MTGLKAGRWVIVSGEREIGDTSGVRFSELAMLASRYPGRANETRITAWCYCDTVLTPLEGDKTHTFIKLAKNSNIASSAKPSRFTATSLKPRMAKPGWRFWAAAMAPRLCKPLHSNKSR